MSAARRMQGGRWYCRSERQIDEGRGRCAELPPAALRGRCACRFDHGVREENVPRWLRTVLLHDRWRRAMLFMAPPCESEGHLGGRVQQHVLPRFDEVRVMPVTFLQLRSALPGAVGERSRRGLHTWFTTARAASPVPRWSVRCSSLGNRRSTRGPSRLAAPPRRSWRPGPRSCLLLYWHGSVPRVGWVKPGCRCEPGGWPRALASC